MKLKFSFNIYNVIYHYFIRFLTLDQMKNVLSYPTPFLGQTLTALAAKINHYKNATGILLQLT